MYIITICLCVCMSWTACVTFLHIEVSVYSHDGMEKDVLLLDNLNADHQPLSLLDNLNAERIALIACFYCLILGPSCSHRPSRGGQLKAAESRGYRKIPQPSLSLGQLILTLTSAPPNPTSTTCYQLGLPGGPLGRASTIKARVPFLPVVLHVLPSRSHTFLSTSLHENAKIMNLT